MADAKMLNKAKVIARLGRLPAALKAAVAAQLKTEAEDLVAAQRRAAPVDQLEPHAGAFRDSIHEYPNPDRELSYRVIADARDDKGHLIGKHIEHGHLAADGSHVPAKPSFFPTYRARKKGMRRRLSAAARKALRTEFPE